MTKPALQGFDSSLHNALFQCLLIQMCLYRIKLMKAHRRVPSLCKEWDPLKSLTMPKGPDSLAFRMSDGPVLSPQICADTGQLSSWKAKRHL